MSDEAFARRFYSDRAELTALGVPLHSQRDEFTGEELYTLRSEHYFLDQLDLDEDELAALQTRALLPRGEVRLRRAAAARAPEPRARPARLPARADRDRASASASRRPTTRRSSPPGSRSSSRRSRSSAPSSSATGRPAATARPSAGSTPTRCGSTRASGTSSATISTATRPRTFRVARIRSDIRFATRRERDFRLPPDFDVEAHRVARPWQIGENAGTARIEVQGDTAWWVHRTLADAGTVVDGVFETPYATLGPLVSWILRQNGRAVPLEPAELRDEVAGRARACSASATTARPPRTRPRAPRRGPAGGRAAARGPGRARAVRRPPGAARAPARRVRRRASGRPRRRRARRAVLDPARGARRRRSRCSTSSTSAAAATRSTPRSTRTTTRPRRQGALRRRLPQGAEAHAARGAGDPARDRVRRPDDRRRRPHAARARAPQARGDLRPVRARARREPQRGGRRGGARPTLSRRRREATSRRARVPEGGREEPSHAPRRAVHDRARAARSGASTPGTARSTARGRTGSTGCARRASRRERFEPREGFDPNYLAEPRRRAPLARARRSPAGSSSGARGR